MKKLFFLLLCAYNVMAQSTEILPGSNGFVMVPNVGTLGTCNNAAKGKIVFYSVDNSLRFCNGSSWVNAAGGSGLSIPYSFVGNIPSDNGLKIENTDPNNYSSRSIYGISNSNSFGVGVEGWALNGSGIGTAGVTGKNWSTTTGSSGVYGASYGSGSGVRGTAMGGSGVQGETSTGTAVLGNSLYTGVGGYFSSNNGHALITNSGNVGIGLSAPAEKLHVNGNVRISGLSTSSVYNNVVANSVGKLESVPAVAFAANCNVGVQNLAHNTLLKFPFNNENFDVGNNFNTTNNEFTAPVNGIYHFNVAIGFGPVNGTAENRAFEIYLIVDYNSPALIRDQITLGGPKTLYLSHYVTLNAGQKVSVNMYQNSSYNIPFYGNVNSYFSGSLITKL